MIRLVLLDLDGVVRHFPPQALAELEARHGLAPGRIHQVAFADELLARVVTGRTTRAAWIDAVGQTLGAPLAAQEWGRLPAVLDPSVLALVDELRAARILVAILTNGTDSIPAELAELGLDQRVDAVFNSAEIGYAKPDRRAFQHVLGQFDLTGPEVFFVDDSASKLAGADELGMTTHLFTGVSSLRAALLAAGVHGAA